MKLIRGLHNFTTPLAGCVATIGNFDGLHLGHQALLAQLKQKAKSMGLPSVVVIFEPQPREMFHPDKVPARLTRMREKLLVLQELDVDYVLCILFTKGFSAMTAAQFETEVLVKQLGLKYLLVGEDFRYGQKRTGDVNSLQQSAQTYGFTLQVMNEVFQDEKRISSTMVRDALEKGDMMKAKALLGRYYGMSGLVAHGDKLGRQLGFPTANVFLHRKKSPLHGIFVVRVLGLDELKYGVANVGNRPAVGGTKTLLEIYIFDFDRDIYSEHIHVEFIHKLRDEENYATLDALKEQIALDVKDAQEFLVKYFEKANGHD